MSKSLKDRIIQHESDTLALKAKFEKMKQNDIVSDTIENFNESLSLIVDLLNMFNDNIEDIKLGQKFKLCKGKGRSKKKLDDTKILELKNLGISNKKIGSIMNVSEATIRRRLKDIQLKKDEPKEVKKEIPKPPATEPKTEPSAQQTPLEQSARPKYDTDLSKYKSNSFSKEE